MNTNNATAEHSSPAQACGEHGKAAGQLATNAAPVDVLALLHDAFDTLESTTDSDIDHFEDDEEEREAVPMQYAARKIMEAIDALAVSPVVALPAAQGAPNGMHAAADFIDAKAAKYIQGNAETEHDTGAVVFHDGEAGRDYHSALVELAEELRALPLAAEPVKPAEG